MPKMDMHEELGLLDLRREIDSVTEEIHDVWMDCEIEERPRFRKPLEVRLRGLSEKRALLEERWLR